MIFFLPRVVCGPMKSAGAVFSLGWYSISAISRFFPPCSATSGIGNEWRWIWLIEFAHSNFFDRLQQVWTLHLNLNHFGHPDFLSDVLKYLLRVYPSAWFIPIFLCWRFDFTFLSHPARIEPLSTPLPETIFLQEPCYGFRAVPPTFCLFLQSPTFIRFPPILGLSWVTKSVQAQG